MVVTVNTCNRTSTKCCQEDFRSKSRKKIKTRSEDMTKQVFTTHQDQDQQGASFGTVCWKKYAMVIVYVHEYN